MTNPTILNDVGKVC